MHLTKTFADENDAARSALDAADSLVNAMAEWDELEPLEELRQRAQFLSDAYDRIVREFKGR